MHWSRRKHPRRRRRFDGLHRERYPGSFGRDHVLFEALLGPRFSTRIGFFAIRGPHAARNGGVIHTENVAQLVELELVQFAGIADAQAVKREVREGHAL